jgi:transposase-like protein
MEEQTTPQSNQVPGKYHRDIPAQMKLEKLMEFWQKEKTVSQVAKELEITEEAVYQWERKSKAELLKILEPEKRGRRPKDHVEESLLRAELEKLRAELAESEKEKLKWEREHRKITRQLWTARHVINFWQKLRNDEDRKKNSIMEHPLKKLFSFVSKKPLKTEKP